MKLALVAFSQTWPSTSWRVGEEAGVVEDVGEHKADHAGDGSGDEEVRHGLPADGPTFFMSPMETMPSIMDSRTTEQR